MNFYFNHFSENNVAVNQLFALTEQLVNGILSYLTSPQRISLVFESENSILRNYLFNNYITLVSDVDTKEFLLLIEEQSPMLNHIVEEDLSKFSINFFPSFNIDSLILDIFIACYIYNGILASLSVPEWNSEYFNFTLNEANEYKIIQIRNISNEIHGRFHLSIIKIEQIKRDFIDWTFSDQVISFYKDLTLQEKDQVYDRMKHCKEHNFTDQGNIIRHIIDSRNIEDRYKINDLYELKCCTAESSFNTGEQGWIRIFYVRRNKKTYMIFGVIKPDNFGYDDYIKKSVDNLNIMLK